MPTPERTNCEYQGCRNVSLDRFCSLHEWCLEVPAYNVEKTYPVVVTRPQCKAPGCASNGEDIYGGHCFMHYSSKEGPMPESKFCVGQQVILKSNAGAVTDVLSGIVDTDIRYEVQLHDGPSVIYTEEELLSITEAVNDSVNAPLSEEDTALVKAAVLDRLASECWTIAHAHGFWDAMERIANEYGDEELISQYQIARCGLIHSEVSELLEAVRESKEENIGLDFHVAEECADIIIRVLDFCGGFDIDLGNAFVAKMEKNRNRPHMHGKKA